MNNNKKFSRGVGIIEIIAATTVAAIFFSAIYALLVFSLETMQKSVREVEAVYLAKEGIEAVRFMRNEGWSANILPLVNGTTYYLDIVGNEWALLTVDPGPVSGVYTREVVFGEVIRDINDDINTVGAVDSGTRKLTVTVDWTDIGGDANNITIETYMTNFLTN